MKKKAAPKYQIPKISVAMSIEDLMAVCFVMKIGKMFSRPQDLKRVESVLNRIGKILVRRGLKQEIVDKLVIL
jgi:glycerate kinase